MSILIEDELKMSIVLVYIHCREFDIFNSHDLLPSDLVAQSGRAAAIKPEGRGFNSHQGGNWTHPGGFASRPTVHFWDNLSALGIILRYTSRRKGFIY